MPEANNNGSKKDVKIPKKDKKRTCFICDKEDHFVNECPQQKQAGAREDKEDKKVAHLTWEANMFMPFKQVNAIGYTGLLETEILLDNLANISIMKPGLLWAVAPAEKTVKANGVGGQQLKVDHMGYLGKFFPVYASDETIANVLSLAEVEELYGIITYVPREAFIVHLPEQDIEFKRKGKLYVADFAEQKPVYVMQVYTKAEEERAKRAYELVYNSRHPSYQEATHLVEDGNTSHMPD